MSANVFLFGALPYVVTAVAIVVTVLRWRMHPFSVSSLSSQLLESRKLYWGSVPFHWGLVLILGGHMLALVIPGGVEAWNGSPARLYVLEATGLALALWAGGGLCVLVYRRMTNARIRRVTTPMDWVVLAIIGAQIVTGVWVAVAYRWGSSWAAGVMAPYIRSLLVFQPKPEYVEAMPLIVKLHILAFFAFIAVFGFTRLIHIATLPLQYLTRPWQKVVADRHARL